MNTILNSDPLRYVRNVAKLTVFRGWNTEEDLIDFYKNLKIAPKAQVYDIPIKKLPKIHTLNLIMHIQPGDFQPDKLDEYLLDIRPKGRLAMVLYSSFNNTNKYVNLKKQRDFVWIQFVEHDLLKTFIVDHYMIPKHELIDDETYKLFVFEKHRINSLNQDDLPTIGVDDPMIVYIGGRVDDIVRITSHDGILYRKIVDNTI